MTKINQFLEWASQNPVLLEQASQKLLMWEFISLLFGFFALLLELHLPLRYYWYLPSYFIRQLLEGFRLKKETPVWGHCINKQNKGIIPFTVIELLDPETKQVFQTTYSNYLGEYGFNPPSGQYYLRAVKNYYKTPSSLDPENLEVVEVHESFVRPISAEEHSTPRHINLELQPIKVLKSSDPKLIFGHYIKTLIFTLGNAFLILGTLITLFSWAITQELVHGILLAVTLILLFIKIYVLETIRVITTVT